MLVRDQLRFVNPLISDYIVFCLAGCKTNWRNTPYLLPENDHRIPKLLTFEVPIMETVFSGAKKLLNVGN
jgi:hypothetical protein